MTSSYGQAAHARERGRGANGAARAASATIRLGYLVPEWPAQTHAFFWREITALHALGVEVTPLSTRRPEAGACRHEFAAEARASTRYVFPPPPAAALRVLARRPERTARALRYLASLEETSALERAKLLGLVPCAAALVAHAEALRLTHVHAHSCASSAHLVHLAHLLGGPRFSLTLHGDLPVYGVDHARKMSRASFVATVTRPLHEQVIAAARLDAARVPIIPMGVDTARFTPAPRSRDDARAGGLRIVTVARLHPVKGHAFVLEAIHTLRRQGLDVRYVIAGEGPHRGAIEEQVRALGLQGAVELPGTIGEDRVLELLREADAFVLASKGLGEAAPVSVMEAMACGLPVICSRIGGTGDMIEHGLNGLLIEPGDVTALTDELGRLARDLDLRKRLGEAARKRALGAFDYRRMAERLHRAIADSAGLGASAATQLST